LEKAIYSHENEWHFWLWLEFYSHFTSPIRRYPDLIIHRIIKEKLHNKLNTERIEYYKSILKNIWKKTSDTERASEKLEYGVKDLFICKYYKDKIWLEEKGIISWIIPAWVFIELENWVEWFLSLDNILLSKNIKKAVYEEEFMRFVLWNNQFLQIWDEVKIKLSGIDDERRRLLFDLVQ
jgi:ribonuclease R